MAKMTDAELFAENVKAAKQDYICNPHLGAYHSPRFQQSLQLLCRVTCRIRNVNF
jgi:hypothetical protein